MFDVFVRDWWRKDQSGRIVPFPGAPREYLARDVETEAEAREMCREYNDENEPGWQSRKAEYERA